MSNLRKLEVYNRTLEFVSSAQKLLDLWEPRHAISGQFQRATESILLNIAEGARLRGRQAKSHQLDYAIGSALECAACLDLAHIKKLLSEVSTLAEKERLLNITRMLFGLRKAWLRDQLSEEPANYDVESTINPNNVMFHYETLDVYQVGLQFMRWFVAMPGGSELTDRTCRELDKSATSILLNIAEGNGRYSQLDHGRFIDIAASSSVKAVTYLDLYEIRFSVDHAGIHHGRNLLERIQAMLSRF